MSSPFLDKHLLFIQTMVQSKATYKKAKENASKGYDPRASAIHAQEYTTAAGWFWVNVPLFSILALLAFPVSLLWNGPLFVIFLRRLHRLRDSRPDQRLRYGIPTWLLITAFIVGLVISGIGLIVTMLNNPPNGVTYQ